MVKSLKRNFITVLLLACVIFSLTLPTLAYDINTPEEVYPTIYNRTKWIGTEVMQPIKDVVESFTGVYTGIADGLYDAYLEVFKNGGTDQQGNVFAGVSPMADNLGSVWYPRKLLKNDYVEKMTNYEPSLIRLDDYTVSLLIRYRSSGGGVGVGTYSFNRSLFDDIAPVSGVYYRCFVGSVSSSDINFSGANLNTLQYWGHLDKGATLHSLHDVLYPTVLDSVWHDVSATYRMYYVIVPDAGGEVSVFGGGQTRGGGAGRRYNLIPAVKADSVAIGSGVSRADVLADYALFDEGTKLVSIPQTDGSTVNYTANTWVYNYETRTYNITTTNSTTVYITYGDDKATVTDGTNPPVDYYYTVPVVPDGGGGDDGGDDDGDGGFWDTILGGLADAILGFFKAVGVVAAAIFEGLVNLLTDAVASIGQLVALVGSLGAVVGGFFAFLPAEVQAAVSAGLIVVVTFSVISVIRK